jgi:biotin carboxylase
LAYHTLLPTHFVYNSTPKRSTITMTKNNRAMLLKAMHVQMADEAISIGPAPATDSYLKITKIISAAEVADVDAIHPGYGFLAENAHFAEICANCNITFIGPAPDCIRNMGDKAIARDESGRRADYTRLRRHSCNPRRRTEAGSGNGLPGPVESGGRR